MRRPNNDIRAWVPAEREYLDILKQRSEGARKGKGGGHQVLQLDACRVYAMCKLFISDQPNGFYTFVGQGKPMDNIIWRDFLLKFDATILNIVRTTQVLEAWVHDPDPDALDFDPQTFLERNLSQFGPVIAAQVERFEKHSVFINHYQSYKRCSEWLWSEIGKLHLEPPKSPNGHMVSRKKAEGFVEEQQAFLTASHQYHSLAKSLVLHAAFMAEPCLNGLFRIGAAPPLRISRPAMKHMLHARFGEKLKIIQPCSIILTDAPDMNSDPVQRVLALMELRNKYVHADESSRHNKLGEILFDNDFPLYPASKHSPGVEFALRVLQRPTFEELKAAYKAAQDFCEYLLSLVHGDYRADVQRLLEQDQLGFNHSKGVYSSIYVDTPFTFMLTADEELTEKAG